MGCKPTCHCMKHPPIHKIFEQSAYGDDRQIVIYLPDEYDVDPGSTYHVLYVFDAQLPVFIELVCAVLNYLRWCDYPAFIIIGIQTSNRPWAFTPEPLNDPDAGSRWGNGQETRGAKQLQTFLQKDVMPFIDDHFRTNKFNVAIGHSLSATFLTWCFLTAPELFNACLAISPNYHYDREQLVQLFRERAAAMNQYRLFYLAYGKDNDLELLFTPGIQQVIDFLQQTPLPQLIWKAAAIENFPQHGSTPLTGVIKGLEFLFSQMTFSNTGELARHPELLPDFYENHITNWYGYAIKPGASELNNLAYKCLGSNDTAAALVVLNWAISLYPDDYNLYDSRGEVKEHLHLFSDAREDYRMSIKVAGHQKNTGKLKIREFEDAIQWVTGRLQKAEAKIND